MIKGMDIPVRSLPVYGEYRYLRFAWKKKGGAGVFMQLGHDQLFGPEPGRRNPSFSFFQGSFLPGQAPLGGAFLHLNPAPPNEWAEHTIDLAASFGEFNLTGLAFGSPDGEFALFDHIWLARTLSEFDEGRLPKTTPRNSPPWIRAMSRRGRDASALSAEKTVAVVNEVAPGFELSKGDGLFGEGVSSIANYRGRPGVLRTHPGSPSDPVRLLRKFPRGKKIPAKMRLSVGHDYRGDWQLEVLANGESLVDLVVGLEASADGWVDLELDLSRFQGEDLVLELLNKANGWSYEYAYWWLVSLED